MAKTTCPVCGETFNDDDIDMCTHRFPACRWCCATGGHNEELPDDPREVGAVDPSAADHECDRYERAYLDREMS